MTQCPYVLFSFYDNKGQKLNIPIDFVTEATWSRTLNNVGRAIIIGPSDCSGVDFETLSQEDLMLSIEVAMKPGQAPIPDLETVWFLRRFKETTEGDKSSYWSMTFKDSLSLLERRIVAYRADEPDGSSPNGIIDNEPGNVALKRIFDTNFSVDAIPERDQSPYLTSQGIVSPSVAISKEIPWKSVLNTMKQICRTSRDKGQSLYFDLIAVPTATDIRFQFKTYIDRRGSDKTPIAIHTTDPLFQLQRFELDYDVPNVGYAGGIGRGQSRVIAIATNPRSTLGRYTRLEDFKSVRSGLASVVNDEAQNLVNNTSGIVRLEGQLLGELAADFGLGDRVLINHRGLEILSEVSQITSSLSLQEFTRVVTVKSVEG